ncbi:hypothetical protein Ahy_B10g106490 [Arachis hypogaea]|uniref:Uncharacterized protein n=1 Tax=Arachis hypogaea TaxID=3818 RepID=A0A444XB06_ARAHY|nr:hypothetical protein Ahy_B10g106490 [Arachis hypogaea]
MKVVSDQALYLTTFPPTTSSSFLHTQESHSPDNLEFFIASKPV